MATFSSDFLQELRDRLRLSDYVGRRVQLRRNGDESSGLCPFHNEKTPSFTVSDSKAFYHCFGCGAHGSVIDWVMETEGLSFPDAVRRLAADAQLSLPAETVEDRAATARRQSLHEVLEAACAWFQQALAGPDGAEARSYLAGRGLDAETIRGFRLGYAPDGRGRLRAALQQHGATDDQLVAAGLMKRPEDGGALRDYFFDRVMFPITDDRGRVVAFGGRTMGDAAAKYLNSPDTEVFHKGSLLYNLHGARAAARSAGTVIAVEGYMDVIALHRAGIRHAVAPLGTAMTERQLELLWRIADEPVLCFDGDSAGRRAAARAAERALPLLQPGKSLRFVGLTPGEDPDSLLRTAGATALARALADTRPLIDLIWESALASHRLDTPEQRAAVEADLHRQAGRIGDSSVRQHYGQMLRDRLRETLRATWKRPDQKRRLQPEPVTVPLRSRRALLRSLRKADDPLVILLAIAVNHPEIVDRVYEPLSALVIGDPELARLRDAVIGWHAENPAPGDGTDEQNPGAGIDRAAMYCHLRAHGLGQVLDWLMTDRIYVHAKPAAPQASADEALRGWSWYFHGLMAAEVRLDKERARADFLTNPDSAHRRIEELAEQERQAQAMSDGALQSIVSRPVGGGD